jgi:hypothetical protein
MEGVKGLEVSPSTPARRAFGGKAGRCAHMCVYVCVCVCVYVCVCV